MSTNKSKDSRNYTAIIIGLILWVILALATIFIPEFRGFMLRVAKVTLVMPVNTLSILG